MKPRSHNWYHMSRLDAVARPEYTGENRCRACTLVNAVVVSLLAALVGSVWLPGGAVVLVGGAAAIALRGYVVPGTPRFAPRVVAALPDGLARHFRTHAADGRGRASDDLADGAVDGDRLLGTLFERGVLVDDGELYLADEFRAEWDAEMATLRDLEGSALADAVAGAAPFEATGCVEFDGVTVEGDDRSVWLARRMAIADAAAVRTLASWDVPASVRAQAATPLRMFLETCPACGGDVEETTARETCCGGTTSIYDSPESPVVACAECGAVLHEFDDSDDEA